VIYSGWSPNNYQVPSCNFKDVLLSEFIQLKNIGKELRTSTNYRYNGLIRRDIYDCVLFQYTFSGVGTIRIGETVTSLIPGRAFLIDTPSDYEYYLDNGNIEWEFIYITLQGEWAKRLVNNVVHNLGNILDIGKSSPLIHLLENSFESVKQRKVKDLFDASTLAYMFLMELFRLSSDVILERYPPLVARALVLINEEYHKIDSIESLASMLSVSKAHLIRLFSQHVGTTPGQCLIQTRIEHAMNQLQNTNYSLDEIAANVGFTNGNYLGKVLRRHLGMPTEEYRNTQSVTSFKT